MGHIYIYSILLLCFDAEGVKGVTSEWGFAWSDNAELVDIAPGRKGENWRPYLQAPHWLHEDYTWLTLQDGRRIPHPGEYFLFFYIPTPVRPEPLDPATQQMNADFQL